MSPRSRPASRAVIARLVGRLCAALGPHADRRQVDVLVMNAMGSAGDHFDANDATQLHLFVHGSLSASLEEVLGPTMCEAVMGRLSLDGLAAPSNRVLIVSEQFDLRTRLEDLLSAHDYQVALARSTNEALAACRDATPGLVLCDADARDGFGVPTYQRMEELIDSCPPIVLLVDASIESVLGDSPMLSKSLDPMAVLTMVQALIGDGEKARPPAPSPMRAEPRRNIMSSPFAPLLGEALELVAAPEIRTEILQDALARAEIDAVPDEIRAFAAFVSGALYLAIRDRFGEDAADAVLDDLRTTSGIHQRAMLESALQPDVDDSPSGVRGPLVRKIVLADDDEHLLAVLSRALREAGYEVMTANNGRDALSLALRNEPEVLVCDMHMPVLSGKDVCQLLRRMRGDHAPSAVLVTADVLIPPEIEDIASVLRKPIKVADLIRSIEAAAQAKLTKVL